MMEETTLINKIVAGDIEAYEQLVQKYHVGLIIHCERLMSSRDDGEDIAQEAFLKAYQKLATFDATKARFSTWLYRIATNLALDELRRLKRKLAVDDIETLIDHIEPTTLLFDERENIRRAVKELTPPEYRAVIEAYFWDGKSYQQIASEHNVPTATIGTWLRRAKTQLRKELSL